MYPVCVLFKHLHSSKHNVCIPIVHQNLHMLAQFLSTWQFFMQPQAMINRQDVEETLLLILKRIAFDCKLLQTHIYTYTHTVVYKDIDWEENLLNKYLLMRKQHRVLFACLRKNVNTYWDEVNYFSLSSFPSTRCWCLP